LSTSGDHIFPLRDYPVREIELYYTQLYVLYHAHVLKEAVEPDLIGLIVPKK
jgi:hypothetical protein